MTFLGFPKVTWIHVTCEVDKSVRFHVKFYHYLIQQTLVKSFNFWQLFKKIKRWTFFGTKGLLLQNHVMKAVNEITARQTLSSLCKHDVRKMCSIDYFTAQTKLVLPTFFEIMDRLQNKRIFHVRGIVYPVKYLPQYNSLLFLHPPYTFSSGFVSDVICCHVTSMPCDVKRAGAQSNSTGGSTDDGVCSCLLKRQYGSTQITLGDAENARPEND